MPIIRGEVDSVRDEIIAEVNYHAAYEPMRSIRTQRWNYVRRFDGRDRPVLPNCDDSLTKTLWLENGWGDMPPATEQLYDLIFDPNEAHNLVDAPRVQDVLTVMRNRLQQWMVETGDPLLEGPIPAPEGAVVNDPDGLSPRQKPRAV